MLLKLVKTGILVSLIALGSNGAFGACVVSLSETTCDEDTSITFEVEETGTYFIKAKAVSGPACSCPHVEATGKVFKTGNPETFLFAISPCNDTESCETDTRSGDQAATLEEGINYTLVVIKKACEPATCEYVAGCKATAAVYKAGESCTY